MQRFVLIRFAAKDVVAGKLILRALELVRRYAFRLQRLELGDERLFRLRWRPPRLHDAHREEQVRMLGDVPTPKRTEAQTLGVDQRTRNSGALTVGKDLRRDVQRICVGMSV